MRVFAPIAPFRRRLAGAALAASTLGLGACLELGPKEACTVTIAPTTITLAVNERVSVVGTAFDCDGNSIRNKTINYTTANPAVATVSSDGAVIGIAPGQTTVSAVANGKNGTAQVTVTAETANNVTITPPSLTLRVNDARRPFTVTVKNAQQAVITRPLSWESTNTTVARVDATGLVTAVAPGSATIIVRADQVATSAAVTVTLVPLQSCTLSPATLPLTVTGQQQLSLAARDTAGAVAVLQGRPFQWQSTDETIASVSATGVVTARKQGTVTISATSVENTSVSCDMSLTVRDARITEVLITPRVGTLRLGIPRQFVATLADSLRQPITGRTATWSTNTPAVIQVTQLGVVTPISLGTARIIATAEGLADTVTLQVERIPVGQVTLTPLQSTIFEGTNTTLTATVRDSTGAVVTDRAIQWLTSDPTRATVTPTGNSTARVNGIAPGNVGITAFAEDRSGQAAVSILQVPVDTIEAPATFTLRVGQTSGFTITLRDAQGNQILNRVVSSISATPSIANVGPTTQTSVVTVQGVSAGETTITLQTFNANGQLEGKRTVVRVTVQPATGN